jgi:glycosyltransferase involved in cell wall biosynthesis
MRILVGLTYYRPYLSGLTLYVERLATGLAARGHRVTVLASQHQPELPLDDQVDGVRVVRVPVAFRLGKGVVMPSHGRLARALLREHDVLSLHVPQFEAAPLAAWAKLLRRPVVLTYHCDLHLPPGAMNRVSDAVVAASNGAAAALSSKIVAYTADYAASVRVLRRFASRVEVIPPPVVMPAPEAGEAEDFLRRHGLVRDDGSRVPTLGMAARFATEKGVDVLLEALPLLGRRFPDLTVLFAGPHENIPGEEAYRARLAPALTALGKRWRFLGPLDPKLEMPAFLAALDCLVVPSVNSTESFGLVQVEAMLCGTPVVASALPGVREVVRTTGMGEVVPVGDAPALAGAVERVLEERPRYLRPRSEIDAFYNVQKTARAYEELFTPLVGVRGAADDGAAAHDP